MILVFWPIQKNRIKPTNTVTQMTNILNKIFIIITTVVDVYVFACIAIEPRWAIFGIALASDYWFIVAIVMSFIILIYFLIEIHRKEMAYREYLSEVLTYHQIEMETLWEEVKYIKEHALIVDS